MIERRKADCERAGRVSGNGRALLACPALKGAYGESVAVLGQLPRSSSRTRRKAERQTPQDASKTGSRTGAARPRTGEKRPGAGAPATTCRNSIDDGRGYLDEGSYGGRGQKVQRTGENGRDRKPMPHFIGKLTPNNKLGKRDVAIESIADLKKRFPQSRWKKDAEALEIEMRQGTGHPVNPDSQSDADLKILALQGIMNNDPSRGIPMLEKYLSRVRQSQGKIEGAVPAGAKRLAAGSGNAGQHRARAKQS